MDKTSDDYKKRIADLEEEIVYLKGLLDEAGIEYHSPKENKSDDTIEQIAMLEDQGARIIPVQLTPQHANFFYSVFKGRRDVYSKRNGKPNPKTGKTGYYTQCWNFWKDGICPKKAGKTITCGECTNQKYKELTGSVLLEHLVGRKIDASDVIGLYPMLPDETCNFLVFDFDNHEDSIAGDDGANPDKEWIREVNAMRTICKDNNVPVIVERSRSGKGAHIWIFFAEPIPAIQARQFGSALLTKGAETVSLKSFKYYDRMLPAQDHMPISAKTGKTGLGNLVALPLQGQALKNGNSAFIDEEWNAYPDQWQVLKSVVKLTKSFIEDKIKEWGESGVLGRLSSEFQDIDGTEEQTGKKEKHKPWEKKNSQFHRDDVSGELLITISDKVYIDIENIKPRMQNMLRRMAAFSNPEFYEKMKMGFSTQGIPRIVYCGYDEQEYICLPRAIREPLLQQLNETGIPYQIKDIRNAGKTINVRFKGTLYPEQQFAAETMLQHDNGILGATTAFGKTAVGAYLVAEKKINTLILVHNTEILKNWEEDLRKFLDISEDLPQYKTKTGRIKKRNSAIGTLYAGHNSMTGIIDVAMFSSLGKKDEVNPIVEQYGMVIMDECHHGAAQTVEDVIGNVKAKYVYGLTATPKRDDGMEKKVYMQFGPVRFRYTAKERAEKQGIDHYVYPRFTRLVSSEDLKINDAYKVVISSDIRNDQIINDIDKCIKKGRTPLVLSKYREHAELLYNMLTDKADHVFLLQGGGTRKTKDEIREKMNAVHESETVILVAIDKYIGEGFNYPRLDTLMLTTPIAWEGNIEQYAGRLHRDYDTKKDVIIYDYVDVHIRVLEKMYHKRMRAYKKIGYQICENLTEVKQKANAIFDQETFFPIYEQDLREANSEIVISSPGLNTTRVKAFLDGVKDVQEKGVRIVIVTLKPEAYPEDRIEPTEELISLMIENGIKVKTEEHMHEHFGIIDNEIVWYGSLNLLSKGKEDDNLIRVKNSEIAQELKEITFGKG